MCSNPSCAYSYYLTIYKPTKHKIMLILYIATGSFLLGGGIVLMANLTSSRNKRF